MCLGLQPFRLIDFVVPVQTANMEPTVKAQRKKLVQSLASLAREFKAQAVCDDAKKKSKAVGRIAI